MRSSIVALLLLSLSACAGDPDLAVQAASLEVEVGPAIERAHWTVAPPGCEGAEASTALHAAASEPLLGVLVDRRGAVVCVDAMALLREERAARSYVPAHPDPTPTPIVLGPYEDPTPTPAMDAPRL